MSARGRLLILVLVALDGSAAASPRRRSRDQQPAPRSVAHVIYLTQELAYVDRGRADGLKDRQVLAFSRGRKPVQCVVRQLAERSAACAGPQVQLGDRFVLGERPPAPSVPRPLPPLVATGELERRRLALAREAQPQVTFAGPTSTGGGRLESAQGALSHQSFVAHRAGRGPFHLEQLDASMSGLRLTQGLSVSIDLSVLAWAHRPPGFRMPVRSVATLRVRRVELTFDDPTSPFTAAAGRFWARGAPMLPLVDGAQAGWKQAEGARLFGVYAGALPDAFTLAPRADQWTAGLYFSQAFWGASGTSRGAVVSARVSWLRTPAVATRLEAALEAQAFVTRRVWAHGQLLLATGAGVEAARLTVDARAVPWLPLRVSARYADSRFGDALLLGASSRGRRQLRGDASLRLDALEWLQLEVTGAGARDLDSALTEGSLGARLELPSLFKNHLAVAAGHWEEWGWLRGRTTFAEARLTAAALRVWARGSLFQQLDDAASGGYRGRELGLAVGVDARLGRWLWLKGSAWGHHDVTPAPPDALAAPSSAGLSLTFGGDL